ncbi:MAG TPA: polysaccharide biosynthesis/export family protein [Vicinamibacteria bacterium]
MLTIGVLLLLLPQAAPVTPPPAAVVPDARGVTVPGKDYRIGAGDILRVTVYGHEDLSQTVVVQSNGRFAYPLIGSVAAAESTPAELEARIKGTLGKGLIRDPQVTVVVQEYRSRIVYVVGEVTRPGAYALSGTTGVVEVLSRAGPLSPNAGSEVVVVRPAAPVGGPVLPADVSKASAATGAAAARADVLRVNLREIQAGKLDQNLVLQANDTVFVPEATRIYVTGEVRNPGAFPYRSDLTVRQAVGLAGGFTEDASTGSARLVREVNGSTRTLKVKLEERLLPGDTIVVKAKLF